MDRYRRRPWPRQHPRSQIDLLKQSIERFGQPKPILARTANHMIIAGHGVHQAMAELGRTDIEVLLWDVDQATAGQYLIADNRQDVFSRDRMLLHPVPLRGEHAAVITAVAFCFNAPRWLSCAGPLIAGTLIVALGGFGNAATIVGLFFILGVVAAPFLPETKGQPLPHALWRENPVGSQSPS